MMSPKISAILVSTSREKIFQLSPLYTKMLGAAGRVASGLVKSATKTNAIQNAVKTNIPAASSRKFYRYNYNILTFTLNLWFWQLFVFFFLMTVKKLFKLYIVTNSQSKAFFLLLRLMIYIIKAVFISS